MTIIGNLSANTDIATKSRMELVENWAHQWAHTQSPVNGDSSDRVG